jgi:hypothetical protein
MMSLSKIAFFSSAYKKLFNFNGQMVIGWSNDGQVKSSRSPPLVLVRPASGVVGGPMMVPHPPSPLTTASPL